MLVSSFKMQLLHVYKHCVCYRNPRWSCQSLSRRPSACKRTSVYRIYCSGCNNDYRGIVVQPSSRYRPPVNTFLHCVYCNCPQAYVASCNCRSMRGTIINLASRFEPGCWQGQERGLRGKRDHILSQQISLSPFRPPNICISWRWGIGTVLVPAIRQLLWDLSSIDSSMHYAFIPN